MDAFSVALITVLLLCMAVLAVVCMYAVKRKGGGRLVVASLLAMVSLVAAAWTVATSPEAPSVPKEQTSTQYK